MCAHLADLESDFSVYHRVDDIYSMDGPKFLRLAERIFAYGGVMAARVRTGQAQSEQVGDDIEALRNRVRMQANPGMGEPEYVGIEDQIKLSV